MLEFAPLGATRLKADARDAPPFLIIGKAPVRAALGPARRAVALGDRRGVGVLHKYRYIPGIYHTDGIYRYIPVQLCPHRVLSTLAERLQEEGCKYLAERKGALWTLPSLWIGRFKFDG